MKVYRELIAPVGGFDRTILFGEVTTDEELEQIFRLRYQVYSERRYIKPSDFPDGREIDDYDNSGKCVYFIAKLGEKVIATIRLINDEVLPTEKIFTFKRPDTISNIPSEKIAEFGRFIIIPPDKESGHYLPRGLVMLFTMDTLVIYCKTHGIEAGLAFVKKKLVDKFNRLRIPVSIIRPYEEHYPPDGILYEYFRQKNDPVLPTFFLTKSIDNYIESTIHKSNMFVFDNNGRFKLKHNLYVNFLRFLKLI